MTDAPAHARTPTLSRAEAKTFYDRFGRWQDWQSFYESVALDDMIVHAAFERAHAVVEIGCGTGALAERLLGKYLPADATYLGLDVSGTMVRLTRERVARWAARARVVETDGAPRLPVADAAADRVVSAYVLDLMSEDDIRALLADAKRALGVGGLFCNVGLTFGIGAWSNAVCGIWSRLHAWNPALVGGCRPLKLGAFVESAGFKIEHHNVVNAFGVCSEVVVAAA